VGDRGDAVARARRVAIVSRSLPLGPDVRQTRDVHGKQQMTKRQQGKRLSAVAKRKSPEYLTGGPYAFKGLWK
jgi:hypothetical protein